MYEYEGILNIYVSDNTSGMGKNIYRVIQKSLRDIRPLRYSSRDGHAEGEHVNRGRDTPSVCPTLQVHLLTYLLTYSLTHSLTHSMEQSPS
jgi:hypothetical protein